MQIRPAISVPVAAFDPFFFTQPSSTATEKLLNLTASAIAISAIDVRQRPVQLEEKTLRADPLSFLRATTVAGESLSTLTHPLPLRRSADSAATARQISRSVAGERHEPKAAIDQCVVPARSNFIRDCDGKPAVIAHGGHSAARPEGYDEDAWGNSYESLRAAYDSGADAVEIDVRLNAHPNSITPETPFGILFVVHNASARQVDEYGRPFGPTINVETADPAEVDLVAMRLDEVLTAFPRSQYPDTGLVIEAKSPRKRQELLMALGLERALEAFGRKTDVVVSSMNDEVLEVLGNDVERMRVFSWVEVPTREHLRHQADAGIDHVAINLRNDGEEIIQHAKDLGLGTVAWYWELTPHIPLLQEKARVANTDAHGMGYDGVISDDIEHLQGLNDNAERP